MFSIRISIEYLFTSSRNQLDHSLLISIVAGRELGLLVIHQTPPGLIGLIGLKIITRNNHRLTARSLSQSRFLSLISRDILISPAQTVQCGTAGGCDACPPLWPPRLAGFYDS